MNGLIFEKTLKKLKKKYNLDSPLNDNDDIQEDGEGCACTGGDCGCAAPAAGGCDGGCAPAPAPAPPPPPHPVAGIGYRAIAPMLRWPFAVYMPPKQRKTKRKKKKKSKK